MKILLYLILVILISATCVVDSNASDLSDNNVKDLITIIDSQESTQGEIEIAMKILSENNDTDLCRKLFKAILDNDIHARTTFILISIINELSLLDNNVFRILLNDAMDDMGLIPQREEIERKITVLRMVIKDVTIDYLSDIYNNSPLNKVKSIYFIPVFPVTEKTYELYNDALDYNNGSIVNDVAISLFYIKDERKYSILVPLLKHKSPAVRWNAMYSLSNIINKDKVTVPMIKNMFLDETSYTNKENALLLLHHKKAIDEEVLYKVIMLTKGENAEVFNWFKIIMIIWDINGHDKVKYEVVTSIMNLYDENKKHKVYRVGEAFLDAMNKDIKKAQ